MIQRICPFLIVSLVVAILASNGQAQPTSPPASPDAASVVEVTARGLDFVEAPDTIPSGWTTVRLNNASEMIHFAILERLPDGMSMRDQQEAVAPVFQEGMNLLNAGRPEAASKAFGELPKWFGDMVFMSGPGLIAPGRTAQTTVQLAPGTYLLECYVKTDGVFHSYNPSPDAYGMVHELTVTEASSGAPAPTPTLEMVLSSEGGIEVDEGNVAPGKHTVGVHFARQKAHEHFLGHDVHLVRLEDDTDLQKLAAWMDWTQPGGLETPAPVEFLGGTHEMPAGETAYFSVELTPGRYAWIAEVPNPAEKGMLRTFTVE